MKLFCVYTPAHEVLYRDWFLPSVPPMIEVAAIPMDLAGRGDFLSEEFLQCIRSKIAWIVESIHKHWGDWIVWTDIDILLFPGLKERLERITAQAGDNVLFFQRETKHAGEVNTGFVLVHCGKETETFFLEVLKRLKQAPTKNEQAVVNGMLQDGWRVEWGYLPVEFVARTHGWPPPRRMAIYHANYTIGPNGVRQKIRQFRQVMAMQRFGLPAILFYTMVRAAEKIAMRMER